MQDTGNWCGEKFSMSRLDVLKSLWTDTCTVYTVSSSVNAATKRTEHTETVTVTDAPCKLSFYNTKGDTAKVTDRAPEIEQGAKLFLSKEVVIPAGSKIVVTRAGREFVYKSSGEPRIFTYHQEISLELFERWA